MRLKVIRVLRLIIAFSLLLSCYQDEPCKDGQLQQIDEVCYECVNEEWEIIDCFDI